MKKKLFENLKQGSFFRYKRKLYIKDSCDDAVLLSNGHVDYTFYGGLVMPVKVAISTK